MTIVLGIFKLSKSTFDLLFYIIEHQEVQDFQHKQSLDQPESCEAYFG